MSIFREFKRRNVLRMAVLYAVAAWLIMQVAEVIIGLANLPEWIGPTILALLAVGFPIALIVSWFYELTPEGISLEKDVAAAESITHVTGRRLDFLVISLLCAGLILFAYDKWWIGPPPEKSIAVLAFVNMSGDPEQEYFSDGISEEILNLLAQIRPLKVIARTSSFLFKNKDVDIATMAAQLNVSHILEGSVRRSGNRVRITAQLIDAADSTHIWSQTYDRELDDIFAVQDEIAAAISDALKLQLELVAGEPVLPHAIKTASIDAYDAYLLGRELIRHRGGKNVENAIRHLEHSLRLDENFAPAHVQLAVGTLLLAYYGRVARQEARRTVNRHLERAEELEPDLAEIHGVRALLADIIDRDPEAAIEHARKALASNPNYPDVANWLYINLLDLGRYEEAEEALRQMLVIDPLTIVGRYNYAELLRLEGRIEEAHEVADELLAQGPLGYRSHAEASLEEGKLAESLSWILRADPGRFDVMLIFNFVGEYDEARRVIENSSLWIDLVQGRYDEGIRVTQRDLQLNPDNQNDITRAAFFLYFAGRIDEALPLYERLLDLVPEGRPISGQWGLIETIRLALARRQAGDEEGAQAVVQLARQDHAARRAAGRKERLQDLAEAMIAAFEHDPDRVIATLKSSMRLGLRDPNIFDEPIFEDLRDEPRFTALQREMDALLAEEHDKVLQLICFNNPVPDDWQPLPETCEGLEEQRAL